MIVVDASVLAPALSDGGAEGDLARRRLAPETLVAPELIDLEVVSVLRRLVRGGVLATERATSAVTDLVDLPMHRVSHRTLAARCLALRDNLTPYDAAYVAVAEVLGVVLVTSDGRLAGAPGLGCEVEVLRPPAAAG